MKPSRNDPILPARSSDGGLRLLPADDGWVGGRLAVPVRRAIVRTRSWLLGQQQHDGAWCAELEGDSILESETILLLAFLGREGSTAGPPGHRLPRAKATGRRRLGHVPRRRRGHQRQRQGVFRPEAHRPRPRPGDMQRARRAILAHGGADAVNSYTRFFLAMLGQIPYDQCPAVPPEMVLLPKWFPVNLYAVSAWSRTIIVPLSIISACSRCGDRARPRHPRTVPRASRSSGRGSAVRGCPAARGR